MIKTILWDLDGTLLPMDLHVFLKHYFRKISSRVAHLIEPQEVLKHIMSSTNIMMNDETNRTNEEVFFESFNQRVNHLSGKLVEEFKHFYKNEFNDLVVYTKPTPLAREILKDLIEKGFKLVLATNPIFPMDAVRARMRWANIEDLPWELVTSYENSCFCKPNLKYYNEILSKINNKPGECMMVGNSLNDDIVAGKLGIKTFLVKDTNSDVDALVYPDNKSRSETAVQPDRQGSLAELASYMKSLPSLP